MRVDGRVHEFCMQKLLQLCEAASKCWSVATPLDISLTKTLDVHVVPVKPAVRGTMPQAWQEALRNHESGLRRFYPYRMIEADPASTLGLANILRAVKYMAVANGDRIMPLLVDQNLFARLMKVCFVVFNLW
jgi:hypothetical protein